MILASEMGTEKERLWRCTRVTESLPELSFPQRGSIGTDSSRKSGSGRENGLEISGGETLSVPVRQVLGEKLPARQVSGEELPARQVSGEEWPDKTPCRTDTRMGCGFSPFLLLAEV